LLFVALRRLGIKGDIVFYSGDMDEILKLFCPGFLGAALAQINILTSTNLTRIYCAAAISVLYSASRVDELPLGTSAVAIATVVFLDMSKLATD
jgi:peptidoglycan biosynthesis protein MviN/MurJ (putative lipid II flippase)